MGGWRTGSSLAWTTSTLHGLPAGSRLGPAAGWRTGSLLARTTSTLHGPPTGSRLGPAAGGLAHKKLAGADDLYTARAANRQPARAGGGGTGVRDALAVDLIKALAANRRPGSLAVLGRYSSACAEVLLYAGRRLAAGPDWLRAVVRSFRLPARQPHLAHRPAPPTHPLTGEPITSPDRAAHTPAALDKTPPP